MPRLSLVIPLLSLSSLVGASAPRSSWPGDRAGHRARRRRGAPVSRPAPPLVDREIFFGNPEISGGQLSPDGRWVSFVKPLDGIRSVWVKSIDEPFERPDR